MAPQNNSISPFFLFKDPSDIQWSGNQRLTGNQLRGFGDLGFDPNISIGNIIPGVSQPGSYYQAPGTRGIFQNGLQIGSTSERNVQKAAPGEGFSLFTSTAANGQTTDALPETVVTDGDVQTALPRSPELDPDAPTTTTTTTAADDGTEFEIDDPGEWKSPVTGWGTPSYNPNFSDPDLTEFTNQHFRTAEYSARYGSGPGEVFQSLGADPVVQMIVQGQKLDAWLASQGEDVNGDGSIDRADYPDRNVPYPSEAQMNQFRAKFFMALQEREDNVQRHIEVIFGSPAFSLGFPTSRPGLSPEENLRANLLDFFQDLPGDIGTQILGELGGLGADILTGLNIPDLAETIGTDIRGAIDPLTGADFGLDAINRDIATLDEKLRSLGLEDLANAITLQGTRLGGLETRLSGPRMQFPAGFVKTAGDLEEQLGGITSDLGELGTSPVPDALFRNLQRSQGVLDDLIGGSFDYYDPTGGRLGEALDQGERLETLLGELPAPPDLSLTGGPLDQARLLNELFTLGEGQLEGLGEDVGTLRRGAVTYLSDDLERLGLGGLEGKIGSFLGEGGTFKNLEGLLGGLGLGGLETQFGDFERDRIPGLQDLLGGLNLGGLEDQFGAFERQGIPGFQGLLDELNLGDLETQFGAFERETLPGFQGDLDRLNIGALEDRIGAFQRNILPPLRGDLAGLGIGGLEDAIGGFQRNILPGLEDRLAGLGIGGLEDQIGLLQRGILPGLEDQLTGLGTLADPLNDLLAGIQAGDFGRLPDLLANAGVDINLPGLDRIETLLGPLTLLPGMGGQIKGLTEDLPREIQKVNDLINQRGGGGGAGGVTDISGLEDSLADILARLDTADGLQPSGSGGVFEELLGAIRPGFTDIRSQIQEMTAELIPQIRAELVADGFEGDIDAEATRRAQAQAAGILRSDPITASILADQEEQDRLREREDRELLQRFGVLRGGQTIDLANLRADDQSRAVLAALGQGAERADERFTQAIGAGTDIAGLLERRELARAGELGFLDGQRTLAGQDQDQALLATIVAMLQGSFNPYTTEDPRQTDLVRALLPLLPPEMRRGLEDVLSRGPKIND